MSFYPDNNYKGLTDPETIGECWITATDYPELVAIAADPAKAPFLDQYIIDACAAINDICKRKFNEQTYYQIFQQKKLTVWEYTNLALSLKPVSSITKVWVQVVDQFSEVAPEYFQLLPQEGVLRILPDYSIYATTTVPYFALGASSNIWVKYVGGYASADVPRTVKKATSLMVSYLFNLDSLSSAESFSTQTYSQKISNPKNDPLLTRIKSLLSDYTQVAIV